MRAISILIVFAGVVPAFGLPLNARGPVKTQSGEIIGDLTGEDNQISRYRGVPYAKPPMGDLRWAPPEPPESWKGVYTARKFSPVAPQVPSPFGGVTADTPMSEDCLYLNIWTPAQSPNDRFPVMVWIHGGGFRIGAGSLPLYDGTNLAEKGVVLVTFNYRLNVFGNFAHPELTRGSRHGASGNYGLLDQVAALEWVKRNIANFGGDPDNVTIFGESAGARSASLHLASPLSRGLFHKAIAQSGALRDTHGSLQDREAAGTALAAQLGADKLPAPLDYLRWLPAEDFPDLNGFPSNPIVDGHFMPEDPEAIYMRGGQADVPLLAGTNRDEGTMFLVRSPVGSVSQYEQFVVSRYGDVANELLRLYPATSDENARQRANELFTDFGMVLHQRNQMKWMAQKPSKNFLYYFTHVPSGAAGQMMGAHHGAEIRYVFGNVEPSETFTPGPEDERLSAIMMDYWVSFARSGDPNVAGRPLWPQFDPVLDQCFEIGEQFRSRFRPRRDRINQLESEFYPELTDLSYRRTVDEKKKRHAYR